MDICIIKNILKEEKFKRVNKLTGLKFETQLNVKIFSQPAKNPEYVLEKGTVLVKISIVLKNENENKVEYEAEYAIDYKIEGKNKISIFNSEIYEKVKDNIFARVETAFELSGLKSFKIPRIKLQDNKN
ncbi:hypothetical protein FV113G1_22410 [Fusobacterium varium]|nr:hypothetical protein FV113G1_22410 [Fusobacterium varium]